MPLLSVIIPHLGNDPALEATILSVLENQPADCEVILVHDGGYADPYQLGDELLILEESGCGPVSRLNIGLMAASAPYVCVLMPGTILQGGDWHRSLQQIDLSKSIGCVSLASIAGKVRNFGISRKVSSSSGLLQQGNYFLTREGEPLGPALESGLYDRKLLLALDGWDERLSLENIDIELALLMNQLGLRCGLDSSLSFVTEPLCRTRSNRSLKELAELSVIHGISGSGAGSAMGELLRGCLAGNVSAAVTWASGILGAAKGSSHHQSRINNAKRNYAQLVQQHQAAQNIGKQKLRAA